MRGGAVFAVVAILLGPAAPAAAQPAAGGDLYVVLYRAGPNWQADKTMAQQLGPHGRYYRGLLDNGTLVAGGAMPATNGGMAIFRAASEAEARQVVAGDPAVKDGVFTAELQHWVPRFDVTGKLAPPAR